jgi:hypothetical protein
LRGCGIMHCLQMTLEHFHVHPAFQADQMIVENCLTA